MKIKYSGLTDKGSVRQANEDSILLNEIIVNYEDHFEMTEVADKELTAEAMWLAVADGMGGHEAGEVASRITLEKLKDTFIDKGSELLNNGDKLKEVIGRIHAEVNLYGESAGNKGMGTTLVGSIFNLEKFLLYNVGDSRVYILRNGYLQQKTRDHSLKEQANIEAAKNIIVSSIGGGKDDIIIDIYDLSGQVKAGDLMLICSDGLTDIDLEANYDEFESIVADNVDDLPAMCKKLLLYSLDKGSSDNISIIAALFGE